ncbi:hypothetical protein [Chryseobacterium sp. BIGb0232]|uniref:hypothetical protein n=1 Tax=Chryseobacterium sp. BIGb0232 TaxID=2940598 RepID=UPI000F4ABD74|nr:hypothetical protein [Chryseobacterium sp. BIGb0232]MCS4300674.1 hypothetical protein [Chryseobacterium sp. BIGb0232]ROS20444.1 hypothetical protein EDF65_1165 [Chryseobacterium nakagawai]
MNTIYESKNLVLEVELCHNNSFNNLFGTLKWIIDGRDIANKDENNLSYFYVDCESLKAILEANTTIKNDLFYISDALILQHWKEWEDFMDLITEDPEIEGTENVIFFDRNYFKTGNILTSFFFDEIMIFYTLENNIIKFKYWYKQNGTEIYEIQIQKDTLIACTSSFLAFFNDINRALFNSASKT